MMKRLRAAPNPTALPIAPLRGEAIVTEDGYPTLRFVELMEQLVRIAQVVQPIVEVRDEIEASVAWAAYYKRKFAFLQAEINSLQAAISVLQAQVAALQTEVASLDTRISNLEVQVLLAAPSAA